MNKLTRPLSTILVIITITALRSCQIMRQNASCELVTVPCVAIYLDLPLKKNAAEEFGTPDEIKLTPVRPDESWDVCTVECLVPRGTKLAENDELPFEKDSVNWT